MRALISSAILVPICRAKPCLEIDMQEQCDTFHLRDIHGATHADEVTCRSTGERSCLVVPGIGGHLLVLAGLQLDAQSPAVDLSVSGRERSPSDVSSDAEVAAAFPASLEFSGALVAVWVLTHLISRPPVRRHTTPWRSSGCGAEEISL